jgi:hypothetical protein
MNHCHLPLQQAIEFADIDHEVWGPDPDTHPKSHDSSAIQEAVDDATCSTMEMVRCLPGYELDPFPGGVVEQADNIRSLLASMSHRLGTCQGECRENHLQRILASYPPGSEPAEQHLRRLSPVEVSSVSSLVYLGYLFRAGEFVFLTPEESAYGQAYPVCEIGYDPLIQSGDDLFFCANPVDGRLSCHAGRRPRFSLRYRYNLTDIRHLPARFRGPEDIVLRMLMRLPLPIISIIRCRGSIHVLIHIPGSELLDRKRAHCELVSLLRSFGGIKASTAPNALTLLPSAIQDGGTQELLYFDPSPVSRPILRAR